MFLSSDKVVRGQEHIPIASRALLGKANEPNNRLSVCNRSAVVFSHTIHYVCRFQK